MMSCCIPRSARFALAAYGRLPADAGALLVDTRRSVENARASSAFSSSLLV